MNGDFGTTICACFPHSKKDYRKRKSRIKLVIDSKRLRWLSIFLLVMSKIIDSKRSGPKSRYFHVWQGSHSYDLINLILTNMIFFLSLKIKLAEWLLFHLVGATRLWLVILKLDNYLIYNHIYHTHLLIYLPTNLSRSRVQTRKWC